ncbi:hypothetical protein HZS_2344 [Henneguya salminicola]|nr:hypothetical protein HZS_2344 [Henneguya salminicola]
MYFNVCFEYDYFVSKIKPSMKTKPICLREHIIFNIIIQKILSHFRSGACTLRANYKHGKKFLTTLRIHYDSLNPDFREIQLILEVPCIFFYL